VTLFSAPDYPQFMADGEARYHNRAAVLHLNAPGYSTPQVESFEAVLPRPQVGRGHCGIVCGTGPVQGDRVLLRFGKGGA
jgi:hypothetical protein